MFCYWILQWDIVRNIQWHISDGSINLLFCVCPDLQSSEIFKENGGPKIIIDILSNEREDMKVLDGCFSVVAAAATGNEVFKESFMDLKIDELIFQILKKHYGRSIPSIYDSIRVILSSDDNRVVASQVSQLQWKYTC